MILFDMKIYMVGYRIKFGDNKMKKKLKKIKRKVSNLYKKVKIKLKLKKEEFDIKIGNYRKAEFSVADLILKNTKSEELLRCDIVVRYLAIEQFYGKNDFGFAMYCKMQNKRVKEGYGDKSLEKFKLLIESYDIYGYDKKSYILLDKNLNLIDGSHRMALALYHNMKNITGYIIKSNHPVEYSVDWFISNGFSTKEVNIIVEKSREIIEKSRAPFSCVIWSPAISRCDEILEDLSYYGKIVRKEHYNYSDGEYRNIVKAIYAIDDIDKWKIEKKLEHMQNYASELMMVDIIFSEPEFRIKAATNLMISKRGERAKKAIRSKYSQLIDNYFFDIVMHIGDNLYQSEYMRCVFEPQIDCKEIISILDKYEYVLTKMDAPHVPHVFPERIPIGKDIDIICRQKDIEEIKKQVERICQKYNKYEVIVKESKYGFLIRILCNNKLIFQIDLAYMIEDFDEDFINVSLNKRVKKGTYYEFSPKYEYIYRLYSYKKNKKKVHHKEYLIEHKEYYDEQLARQYIGCTLERVLY